MPAVSTGAELKKSKATHLFLTAQHKTVRDVIPSKGLSVLTISNATNDNSVGNVSDVDICVCFLLFSHTLGTFKQRLSVNQGDWKVD